MYLLTDLKPRTLLAMGGWHGVQSDGDPKGYWAPRFLVVVPEEFMGLLFPWVRRPAALVVAGWQYAAVFQDHTPMLRGSVTRFHAGWLQAQDLRNIEAEMKQQDPMSVPQSLSNWLKLLPVLTVVVVQDALELADEFPGLLAHKLLLENETFKWAHRQEGWEHQRARATLGSLTQVVPTLAGT